MEQRVHMQDSLPSPFPPNSRGFFEDLSAPWKRSFRRFSLLALVFTFCCPGICASRNSHRQNSSGSHSTYVHGYTRKGGVYVAPHERRSWGSSTESKPIYSHRYRTHAAYGSTDGLGKRDSRGRIKRSSTARDAFKRQQPCPSTGRPSGSCAGYVIDHIKPLECGGADDPANMQWQTVAEGKAKDKTERYCR